MRQYNFKQIQKQQTNIEVAEKLMYHNSLSSRNLELLRFNLMI